MAEKLTITAMRMRARMDEVGITQDELAELLGVTQGAISLILTGKTQRSRLLPRIASLLAVNLSWLLGENDELIDMLDEDDAPVAEDDLAKILKGRSDRKLGKPPTYRPIGRGHNLDAVGKETSLAQMADQLDLVAVQEIDLKFGMGATELELPVTSQVRHFSRDWLRQYTHANPDKLYFAQGIGNSMEPTILDSDLLLIDTSEQSIRIADKFYAIAFYGSGMVKRLRPGREGVRIMSDNPSVPDEIATDGELHVLGRVVGIVRKM